MSVVVSQPAQSLREYPVQTNGRIEAIRASEDVVERLEGLGLCVGRVVRVVKRGEPFIVHVYGTQIGIASGLVSCIDVQTDDASSRQ